MKKKNQISKYMKLIFLIKKNLKYSINKINLCMDLKFWLKHKFIKRFKGFGKHIHHLNLKQTKKINFLLYSAHLIQGNPQSLMAYAKIQKIINYHSSH
jgi:hypothetical protein